MENMEKSSALQQEELIGKQKGNSAMDKMEGNEKKLKDFEKMFKLGSKVMMIGATGSGKSTLCCNMAHRDSQDALKERLSDGRGTRTNTNIVYTDNTELSTGEMYVNAKIVMQHLINVDHLSEVSLLGNMLYALALFLSDTSKTDKSDEQIAEALIKSFEGQKIKEEKDNTALVSKLYQLNPNFTSQTIADIMFETIFKKTSDYKNIITEALNTVKKKAKAKKWKGNAKIKKFVALVLTDKTSNYCHSEWAEDFYKEICKIINEAGRKAVDLIKANNGIYSENKDVDGNVVSTDFQVILNEETKELNQLLLSPNGNNIEFLLSDFNIMVRAGDDFFNNEKFKVGTKNGTDIHQVIVVDTQGIGHKQDDDSDRVINDIQSVNPMIILMLAPLVNDATVKKSGEIISDVLMGLDSDISVIPMFNKCDMKLFELDNPEDESDNLYEKADIIFSKMCDEITDHYKIVVEHNENKHKPRIVDTKNKLIFGWRKKSYIDYFTIHPDRTYSGAIPNIFHEIANILSSKVCSITEAQIRGVCNNLTIVNNKTFPSNSIVNNLRDCISKVDKLHWNTIYAAMNKWVQSGKDYISNAAVFENIETQFIESMKILPRTLIHDMESKELNDFLNDNPRFRDLINQKQHLFESQFAKDIGIAAEDDTIQQNQNKIISCYEYFKYMLKYTLNLFDKKQKSNDSFIVIVPDTSNSDDKITKIVKQSFSEYLRSLIDSYCVTIFD